MAKAKTKTKSNQIKTVVAPKLLNGLCKKDLQGSSDDTEKAKH